MSFDSSGRPAGLRRTSPAGGHAQVIAVTGDLDARASRRLKARIVQESAESAAIGADLIVDLSGVRALSPPGITVLLELTEQLSRTGRRLRLVTGASDVLRMLRSRQATDLLEAYDTMDAAVGAVAEAHRASQDGSHASPDEQFRRLREEIDDLRAKLRTRPVIARALGMLQERYHLPDMDAAFRLLRDGSQHGNVKLHTLAGTLVGLPSPAAQRGGPDGHWPPADLRPAEPEVPFAPADGHAGDARAAVLTALLDTALVCTRSEMGDVRLVRGNDRLRSSRRQGLTRELAEFLDRSGATETTSARALRSGARIVVPDVAADPDLAETAALAAYLDAGIHAAQSTPMIDAEGECVGVVSTYHEQAGHVPTAAERDHLDRIGAQAVRWLDWYETDRVFTALEGLHRDATSA